MLMNVLTEIAAKGYVCVGIPAGDPREFLQKIDKQITRQTGRAWLAH